MKRQNKIVQEIMRNVANVFSFYAIKAIKHGFQCINIRQVPCEVLKTAAMFDPYISFKKCLFRAMSVFLFFYFFSLN